MPWVDMAHYFEEDKNINWSEYHENNSSGCLQLKKRSAIVTYLLLSTHFGKTLNQV